MPLLIRLWRVLLGTIVVGANACAGAANLRADGESNVLFSFDRKQAKTTENVTDLAAPDYAAKTSPADPQVHLDAKVVAATHEHEIRGPTERDPRRLAPATRRELLLGSEPGTTPSKSQPPFAMPQWNSLGTAGTGLALVVGLFLLCVALMRKSGPSATTPLPQEAVAVLGRVPLMPKQFAHLLQVGNKLVLVSIAGDRTDTITEITDPVEVDRLLAVCMKGSRQSSSAEFQRVLGQLAKEPARGFLGREAAYSQSARG